MQEAIDMVNIRSTISAASTETGVPKKTQEDKVKGNHPQKKAGSPKALSDKEEQAFVGYIKFMAERAFPLTLPMIKMFVWSIAKRSRNGDRFDSKYGPGDIWWNEF